MSNIKEIKVPDIGNYKNVEIIEISIKDGQSVNAEDSLITLETDKAAMEVPCPEKGVIQTLKVKVGDKVSQGDVIAILMVAGDQAEKTEVTPESKPEPKPEPKPESKPEIKTEIPAEIKSESKSESDQDVHAGPSTRRLARELGVDLGGLTGTGHKGRIVTKDIHDFVKALVKGGATGSAGLAIEKAPEVDFSQFGEIEVKALSRIKKWTAKNLHRNWVTIPHVTQFDEADITELEVFRRENKQAAEDLGIKLTPLVFVIKAVISALRTFPQFNASLASNGSDLIYKKYYNIGVAVDTPQGLVVPVIRSVHTKGLFDLARELSQISQLAREGKLSAEQMQGSCFTLTSLGGIGGTAFTPIINAPDVAILGISKAQIKPVYQDNAFVPRTMLPLCVSYDHRVIDGVEGAKFTLHIAEQLQDIRKLLL